jgi:hypothetical protein
VPASFEKPTPVAKKANIGGRGFRLGDALAVLAIYWQLTESAQKNYR